MIIILNHSRRTMARKKRRNKKRQSLKDVNLPEAGLKSLSNGKFTEAIRIFRLLYKEQAGDQYAESFKSAFKGRINQLLIKGMFKEALIIFKNMRQVFPETSNSFHIALLVKAGEIETGAKLYNTVVNSLSKTEKNTIEELFASLLLSGCTQLKDHLPEDSMVILHYSYAEAAMQAYCNFDDERLGNALSAITFRSPYKHFRLALNGMLAFHEDPQNALPFFAKIDKRSPFRSLAAPYLHLVEKKKDRVEKPTSLENKITSLLKGYDQNSVKLSEALNKQHMTAAALYQTLVTTGKYLGRERLRKICYRILPHADQKIRDFEKRFGKLSQFENARLIALVGDIDEDFFYDTDEDWQDVIDILVKQDKYGHSARIALIYQHVADFMARETFEYSQSEVREMLERSLDFNPDDKEVWLQLVNLKYQPAAKRYKTVNAMLDRFSEDTDVLTIGIEAAIQRGAFKKASTLAGKLLKLDPLNPKVRLMLIDAHLSHAVKLARQGKYALGSKECDRAAIFDRKGISHGKIKICHGLLTLLLGNSEKGLQLLSEGEQQAESLLLAHFSIRLEAELFDIPAKWIKRFTAQLKKTVKAPLEKAVFLQLVDIFSECNGEKHFVLQNFCSVLTPCLKKGVKLSLAKDDLLRICQIFKRRRLMDILLYFAQYAVKRFPENPSFTFYLVFAKTQGGEKRISRKFYNLLDGAYNDAMEKGDNAAAKMIDDFLNKNIPNFSALGGLDLKLLEKIMHDNFVEHLESGTEPSDSEIDQLFAEITAPDTGKEDSRSPAQDKKPGKAKQLKLF